MPQCSPGTKEEWAPKVLKKELDNIAENFNTKLTNFHTSMGDWKTALAVEVKASQPDALSADEVNAVADALPGGAKYLQATTAFGLASSANKSLLISSYLQPIVLGAFKSDVGTFYKLPTKSTSRIFVDLKNVTNDTNDYTLNFPARVVVCQASDNSASCVLKNTYKKGFFIAEIKAADMTMDVIGVPTPAMLQPGDSQCLAWTVRVAKDDEEPSCEIKTVATTLANPPSVCTTESINMPELHVNMQALKTGMEAKAGVTVDEMESTMVELTRKPFEVEIALREWLDKVANARKG